MPYEQMIEQFQQETALDERKKAERVFRAILSALGKSMHDDDKQLLFRDLPEEIMHQLRAPRFERTQSRDEIARQLASGEQLDLATAMECLQIACGTLADAMSAEPRKLIRLHLPQDVGALFEPRKKAHEITHSEASVQPSILGSGTTLADGRPTSRHPISASQPERTLATGRPGSEHPLSEASDARPAQQDSVVTAANPHGDRKLSTGSR